MRYLCNTISYLFVLGIWADRPEIKNDAEDVIASELDGTGVVAGSAYLNVSHRGGPQQYVQWTSLPNYWPNTENEPYSDDEEQPDKTFHKFSHLSGLYTSQTHAAEESVGGHETSKVGTSKFLRVWASTTKDSEPSLPSEGLIAIHGKYMVLKNHIAEFLNLNHEMVQDDTPRHFDGKVFLYGYVVGPHDSPDAHGYFHTYYVYAAAEAEKVSALLSQIQRHETTKPIDQPAPESHNGKTLQERWNIEKHNWIKLPDTMNWQSIVLLTTGQAATTHKTTKFVDEPITHSAIWTTCLNALHYDSTSPAVQTHIIDGKPANTLNSKVYHALQIFADKQSVRPNSKMLGQDRNGNDIPLSTCRFQNLLLTAIGTGTHVGAFSLDENDLVFHTEYEVQLDETKHFEDATRELFKSPHFKQALLFSTSGKSLDGKVNHHQYIVLESPETWFYHTNSIELANWFFDRGTKSPWIKLTDLVNMKSPTLRLHGGDTPTTMDKGDANELRVSRTETDLLPWSLHLEEYMSDVKPPVDFTNAYAALKRLRADEKTRGTILKTGASLKFP